MKARLKAHWENVKDSLWFLPSLMALGAIALSFLMVHIDQKVETSWVMAVGMLLRLLSLGVLIYFIHHVADSIQVDHLAATVASTRGAFGRGTVDGSAAREAVASNSR